MTELLTRLATTQFSTFVSEYGIVNPDPNSKIEAERYAVFPASALPQFAENAWIVLEDGDLERLGAEDYSAPVGDVGELEDVLVTEPAVLIDSGQSIADAAQGSDGGLTPEPISQDPAPVADAVAAEPAAEIFDAAAEIELPPASDETAGTTSGKKK